MQLRLSFAFPAALSISKNMGLQTVTNKKALICVMMLQGGSTAFKVSLQQLIVYIKFSIKTTFPLVERLIDKILMYSKANYFKI